MADAYNEGDLVWARATGHGWWPGQVMDPARAAPKVQRQARARTRLLSFFGDNSYGWFDLDCIEAFEPNYEMRSKQNSKSQKGKIFFRRAVEEAREVADARAGRPLATSHNPVDFLRPETWPPEMVSGEAYGLKVEVPPCPPAPGDVEGATAADAARWLWRIAAAPEQADQVSPELRKAASALVWGAEHATAVAACGAGARTEAFKQHKGRRPGPKGAAATGAAAAAATGRPSAATPAPAAAASGGASAAEASPSAAAQSSPPPAAAEQQGQSKQAAALPPLPSKVSAAQKRQVMAYGGTISQVTLPGLLAWLQALAVSPTSIKLANQRQARHMVVLLRYRETFLRSSLRREGALSPMVRKVLEDSRLLQHVAPEDLPPPAPAAAAAGPAADGEPQRAAAAKRPREPADGAAERAAGGGQPPKKQQFLRAQPQEPSNSFYSTSEDRQAQGFSDSDVSSSSDDDEGGSNSPGLPARPFRKRGAAEGLLAGLPAARRPRLDDLLADKLSGIEAVAGGNGRDDSAEPPEGGSSRAGAGASTAPLVQVVCKQYADKIGSKEAFIADLQRWYGQRNIAPVVPVVGGVNWDHYTIFKLVAAKGGADAATKRKAWRSIGVAWKKELARVANLAVLMRQHYRKTLGTFEDYFSAGAPTQVLSFKQDAAAGAGRARPAAPAPAPAPAAGRGLLQQRRQLPGAAPGGTAPGWEAAAARRIKPEPGIKAEPPAPSDSSSSEESQGEDWGGHEPKKELDETTKEFLREEQQERQRQRRLAEQRVQETRNRQQQQQQQQERRNGIGRGAPGSSRGNQDDPHRRRVLIRLSPNTVMPTPKVVAACASTFCPGIDLRGVRLNNDKNIIAMDFPDVQLAVAAERGLLSRAPELLELTINDIVRLSRVSVIPPSKDAARSSGVARGGGAARGPGARPAAARVYDGYLGVRLDEEGGQDQQQQQRRAPPPPPRLLRGAYEGPPHGPPLSGLHPVPHDPRRLGPPPGLPHTPPGIGHAMYAGLPPGLAPPAPFPVAAAAAAPPVDPRHRPPPAAAGGGGAPPGVAIMPPQGAPMPGPQPLMLPGSAPPVEGRGPPVQPMQLAPQPAAGAAAAPGGAPQPAPAPAPAPAAAGLSITGLDLDKLLSVLQQYKKPE